MHAYDPLIPCIFRLEEQDMRSRYGGKKYTSQLLLAERIEDYELVGCVGVDVQVIDMDARKLRTISTWTNAEDEIAVLANLVVRRVHRGKGLAKQLGRECERQVVIMPSLWPSCCNTIYRSQFLLLKAREWGVSRIGLTVEENNKPAKKLYQKLGYKVVFEDTEATCVLPGRNIFCFSYSSPKF